MKRDFAGVDTRERLDKVNGLALTSWRFVNEPPHVRHVGPIAEDFRAAFGLGSDERSFLQVDAQGVALAAIRGLDANSKQRSRRVTQNSQRCAREIARLRLQALHRPLVGAAREPASTPADRDTAMTE